MEPTLFCSKLTAQLHLGTMLAPVARVHGGLMHTMYQLDTDTGRYVVKLLNPHVMQRAGAKNNFLQADILEYLLAKNEIPIVSSLVFNDKKMQEIDGQFFYVYNWYGGSIKQGAEITTLHCQKISEALFRIHAIGSKQAPEQPSPLAIDWEHLIAVAHEQGASIYPLLQENKALLCEGLTRANLAMEKIPAIVSLCHNDMDSKNVLWLGDDFKIIDLECLGFSNPYLELLELALCWSGYEQCNLDIERFSAFITGYFKNAFLPNVDWDALYNANCSRLAWLAYNVKRALLLECDCAEEQALGVAQVEETLRLLVYYYKIKPKILHRLAELLPA